MSPLRILRRWNNALFVSFVSPMYIRTYVYEYILNRNITYVSVYEISWVCCSICRICRYVYNYECVFYMYE